MKFPKHRSNCFVVTRNIGSETVVCGVFPTDDGADAFCGACQQEWDEREFDHHATFEVVLATYYDA
jgi:hypothetical protein